MIKRSFFGNPARIVFLAACFSVPIAGGAGAESFEEALAKAYMNNPTIQASRAELRATDEEIAQALSGWRPSVTVTYQAGKEHSKSKGTFSAGSDNQTPKRGSAGITQNLYRGGQTVAATKGADASIKAQRAELLSVEQEILLAAGTAYVDVARDLALVELNKGNSRVLQRQLDAAKDRFEVGEVTRTDVSQAESRLSRSIADRIAAEGRLANSRATYRNIVGDYPGKIEPFKPLGDLPKGIDEALAAARAASPDVVAARYNEEAAKHNIDENFADLLPRVDVEGNLTRSDQATSPESRSETAEIFARITVPLYQGGAVSSEVRQAKQIHGQRRKELDAAVRTAVERATRSWEDLLTAQAQIKAFSAEIKAAEIALDGVKQEAQVGSRTVLDVLDAEQELLDARVSLIGARRDEFVARMALRQAVGTLTAKSLNLPVKLYDPEQHYRKIRNKWWGPSVDGK